MLSTDYPSISLSIVVVVVYSSAHLRNCLTALHQQVGAPDDIEIIVVYHEGVADISELRRQFNTVQFYRVLGQQTQDALRSFGVKRTRGKIVAITVDHCTPEKHWCGRILEAHKKTSSAIGGAVEKGIQPDTAVNWAVHLYDYSSYGYYLNPVLNGPANSLSDCNASYKREILLETVEFWGKEFNVPLYNKTLMARGEELWLLPDLIVYQNRSIAFGRAARVAFQRGRAFARARLRRATFGRRTIMMGFSFLVPIKLTMKLLKNIMAKRKHFKPVAKSFPFVISFTILWSMGEFWGSIRPSGKHLVFVNNE